MKRRKLASVQYIHHITPIDGADKVECISEKLEISDKSISKRERGVSPS